MLSRSPTAKGAALGDDTLPQLIGSRLRRLRKDSGRSLASVAQQMGISSSALSQMETGALQPSVNRLVELVTVLGAPISAIFDDVSLLDRGADADVAVVTEPIPGVLVAAPEAASEAPLGEGVVYRRLTPVAIPGLDLFESTYPPGTSSSPDGAMLVHGGYESGHVVSGTLVFEFSEGEVELTAGGSLSFHATRPHRVANRTGEVAVAVWVTLRAGIGEQSSAPGGISAD